MKPRPVSQVVAVDRSLAMKPRPLSLYLKDVQSGRQNLSQSPQLFPEDSAMSAKPQPVSQVVGWSLATKSHPFSLCRVPQS